MMRDALLSALPVFRALGEPVRVRIIETLLDKNGPATVGEIQATLAIPQSTVSRHLRILLDAHLLAVTRDGAQRHYRLDVPEEALNAIEHLVREVRACQSEKGHRN
ncbi:ArsR/SmtB family transcription factor [Amycolatopsis taiwanensis]|uniref:HTH arsR-type domain-containing protein n=1 Tax=Amycolatopsis taiwanensis TaxID=342230 RepID=A0A9W6R5F5_9PSEU|nr:metalloregulator ArsR/SmtB family transcription factor [Amycolatopsis taiwanensis]GLY69316.1 hypothetical protein Atai01_59350 [Amycolatopsis taiwanensis]